MLRVQILKDNPLASSIPSLSPNKFEVEETFEFVENDQDATIIPSVLATGANPFSIIGDLRESEKGGIIIGVARDSSLSPLFLRSGAHWVISRDTDSEMIFQLIERGIDASNSKEKMLLSVLQSIDEGILILNEEGKILFFNDSAQRSLGATILQDKANLELFESKIAASTQYLGEIQEIDFRSFSGSIRVREVKGKSGSRVGYIASLIDKRHVQRISEGLAQGERTHSLFLTTAAACLKLLKSNSFGSPTNPLELLERTLSDSSQTCELSRAVSLSCEILDLVISPMIAVKLSSIPPGQIALPFSEAFRLLGLLLFTATDFSGPGGEVKVATERSETFSVVTLRANSIRPEVGVPYDLVLHRVRQSRELLFSRDGSLKKLPYGMQEVKNILAKWGGTLKYREKSDETVEYIVQLPNSL